MTKPKNEINLTAVRIVGGVLSSSLFDTLRRYQLPGQAPGEYGIEKGLALNDELGRYFRIAQSRWQECRELEMRQDMDGETLYRKTFLLPLFNRVLGFELLPTDPIQIEERVFPVSHTAFGGAVPVLFVPPDNSLDREDEQFGDQDQRRSPTGLIQEYLNASPQALWGIVCNGHTLRLLRDNPSITRPAFIEIDLELILEDGIFSDFSFFWLLCHNTRLSPRENMPEECFLEQWRIQGQTDGERILGRLRNGVTHALRLLGSGFVAHPDNTDLRQAIREGTLSQEAYFQELLRLVYRLLFLFTTEDRGALPDPQAPVESRKLYIQGYSLVSLREKARLRRHHDHHWDGWEQLLINFSGYANGQEQIAQPALGGLFAKDQCPHLDQCRLANSFLYKAIFKLSYFQTFGALFRVNYKDMGTEELGSVYEALLELIPQVKFDGGWRFGFFGDDEGERAGTGNERKTTGSYYTPDSLVRELIQSALVPVIKDRLAQNPENPRQALLDINVCDPACGSGHFLLSAARCLAGELARIDAGTSQPSNEDFCHALREVVSLCIYGVDINPLAVELCRTALWLEAIEPGRPLSFLDARIQVGNSLVGLLHPQLMEKGIPAGAFKAVVGDDKDVLKSLRQENKMDPKDRDLFENREVRLSACAGDVLNMPEESLAQVEEKRRTWLTLINSEVCRDERLGADLFTAAFFAPKNPDNQDNVPTNMTLAAWQRGEGISEKMRYYIQGLAQDHGFFHWYLAFPEVFDSGGFDVLLGNPPWDVSQLVETEYFTAKSPEIAALKGAKRKKAIKALEISTPFIWTEYLIEKRKVEANNSLFRGTDRFHLTAVGKLNLYSLFAELSINAVKKNGRVGILVPSGIATDDSNKYFFGSLTTNNRLVSLYDFENKDALFPGVHRSFKFCMLTIGKVNTETELAFFSTQAHEIKNRQRCFTLSGDDFSLINPNTLTCPVFRSQKDAELTKKIYRSSPILIKEATKERNEENPWGIHFSQGLFNMTSASHLFKTFIDFEEEGGVWRGPEFELEDKVYLPLFEAKMVHHYDHCWATYETDGSTSRDCGLSEKQDPEYFNLPRYWVDAWEVTLRTARAPEKVLAAAKNTDQERLKSSLGFWAAGHAVNNGDLKTAEKLLDIPVSELFEDELSPEVLSAVEMAEAFPFEKEEYQQLVKALFEDSELRQITKVLLEARRPAYLIGWRDICRATDERTVISDVIPLAAVGDTFLLMFPKVDDKRKIACLLADQNSIVHDFIARQKIGGTHLKYHVKKQITTLPPDRYSKSDLNFILPRVLELTYTSHTLKSFAQDLGYEGEPFAFDPERRHLLKSELDAYYARLYGLSREDLQYILDPADVMREDYPSETFRVLKNKEIKEFGEYRTRRLVLEAWDKLGNETL